MEKGVCIGLFLKRGSERSQNKKSYNKKSQITIFVIIGIVLVLGIGAYFLFNNYVFLNLPKEISPVYDAYGSCISALLRDGSSILGSQAGYIYYEDFEPGSAYAPFSSVLDFAGMGVPYWYYISANGIKKEQIPSKTKMEKQLAKYISEEIKKCDLSSFKEQGYSIELGENPSATVSIDSSRISASFNQNMVIKYGEQTFSLSRFKSETDSRIGKLYDDAKKIYDYEMKNMFLENYSVDVLYTYAPVSGALLNCSPMVWSPYDVFNTLKKGLSANIGMIKINGNYYSAKNKYSQYYVVGENSPMKIDTAAVNFLYSANFPSRFEVWPTENGLMKTTPLGTQPGLSALGFCYSSYKFVYDMYFPVLIQLMTLDGEEVFQFPVAVVINKNMPREAVESEYIEPTQSICDNANTKINIRTYNVNLEPVEADIKFKCILDTCDLGKTLIGNGSNSGAASLDVEVPQCGNGILIAKAPGYKEKKYTLSTNSETAAGIVLEKEYTLGLEIYVDGKLSNYNSVFVINKIVSEDNNGNSEVFVDSVNYPQSNVLKISEGNYKFDLRVFGKGKVVIPAEQTTQCVKTSREDILGLLGFEEEKCYDITVPSQEITNLPTAGGYAKDYLTPSQLSNSRVLRVYAISIPQPSTIEEIQASYDEVENKKIKVELA